MEPYNPSLIEGKVGLVTGAGSPQGIGRSIVLALAKAGAKSVYACDLNLDNIPSLQQLVKESGSSCQVEGLLLDVSSEEQTVKILKHIIEKHGRFDFYFSNAGFHNYRTLDNMELKHFERAMSVMTTSGFLAIKYGSKAMMVTSKEKPNGGGAIIITSSCCAFLGAYADIAYTTAKVASHGLVTSGSVQLSTSNIRVNGIAPGYTNTSILSSSQFAEKGAYSFHESKEQIRKNHQYFLERGGLAQKPEYYYNRFAEPEEIAHLGVFLASDLSSAINGQIILADSGKTEAAKGEGCTGPVPPVEPLQLK